METEERSETGNTTSSASKPIYRGARVVWYLAGILEVILAFRFVLKLLGANPAAGFTQIIYGISEIFVMPFLRVFGITRVVQGSVLEWTTLLAMLVYWLITWLIVKLLLIGKPISRGEAADKLDKLDDSNR